MARLARLPESTWPTPVRSRCPARYGSRRPSEQRPPKAGAGTTGVYTGKIVPRGAAGQPSVRAGAARARVRMAPDEMAADPDPADRAIGIQAEGRTQGRAWYETDATRGSWPCRGIRDGGAASAGRGRQVRVAICQRRLADAAAIRGAAFAGPASQRRRPQELRFAGRHHLAAMGYRGPAARGSGHGY